jgi:hypothetical protein
MTFATGTMDRFFVFQVRYLKIPGGLFVWLNQIVWLNHECPGAESSSCD